MTLVVFSPTSAGLAAGAGNAGVAANANANGGGVGYATCDALAMTCAADAADIGEGCATANSDLTVFPGSTEIEACTGWGIGAGAGLALKILAGATVNGTAEVVSESKGPGTKCKWWKPWTWNDCGEPKVVEVVKYVPCHWTSTLLDNTGPHFISCVATAHAMDDALCFTATATAYSKNEILGSTVPTAAAEGCKADDAIADLAAADVPVLTWAEFLAAFTSPPTYELYVTGVPAGVLDSGAIPGTGAGTALKQLMRAEAIDAINGVFDSVDYTSPDVEELGEELRAAMLMDLDLSLSDDSADTVMVHFTPAV